MINTTTVEDLIVKTSERSTTSIVIIFLLTVPLIALTILGNSLVILAWIAQKSVRSAQNAYYVSLAFTDFFIGTFVLPFVVSFVYHQKWIYGLPLCKAFQIILFSLSPISIFHLVAIAFDRYRTVTEGVSYVQRRTLKSVYERCACIWILGLILSMPLILDFDHIAIDPTGSRQCISKKEPFWVLHITVYCFIIPLFLILRIYWKIYAEIQKRSKNKKGVAEAPASASYSSRGNSDHSSLEPNNDEPTSSMGVEISCSSVATIKVDKSVASLKRERRAIKTLAIIIGAYVVCWTPWFGFICYVMFLPEDRKPSPFSSGVVAFLGYTNSCINPIIYAFRHPEFRDAFHKMVGRRYIPNP